jgi:hypothetical protein
MRTGNLSLVLAAFLSSCVRSPFSAPSEEDRSITFPEFYARPAVVVGKEGDTYDLDGEMLRAISIAANDFSPPDGRDKPCWRRQESHRYRAIRQEDVIFVQIYLDPMSCGRQTWTLDGGVKYAISIDGRILRRLFDGEPEGPLAPDASNGGAEEVKGTLFPASEVGKTTLSEPSPLIPSSWLDAGSRPEAPDAGSPLPDAGPPAPDGGPLAPDAGTPPPSSPPDAG